MTLLSRYKDILHLSVAYDDDAYRLFLASYIVASKVLCDAPRKMRFWKRAGGDKFSCDELMKMELEFCRVLSWDVQIEEVTYTWFRMIVDHYAIAPPFIGNPSAWITATTGLRRGTTAGVYSTPPPLYQEIDVQATTMVDELLLSPEESLSELGEEDQEVLGRMRRQRSDAFQYHRAGPPITRKKSSNAGFTKRLLSIVQRKPSLY
ncbi:hypothetical protein B0H34DRAFT_691199 [Crassisporium funariophilum]|nr:hypothetical protein B0H34DRAFT_691199 [Crassisporium funariophilum]